MNARIWTLGTGVAFAQQVEKILGPLGFHCALGGSVLHKGESEKDLDIFVYPHRRGDGAAPDALISALKSGLAVSGFQHRDHTHYGDSKQVYSASTVFDYRVDFFFL